ncbi:IS21-like element helper ATPase IstB [Archangium violaceum]|nr:IS21-like element helper ATPase IstB [Archangium violaceum]QRK14064.1 IS21-like element helper ATPase IstB [Archangium violaceum]QRK14130.1 IS21-like element helper ATPase IstB [Archangium violaceum]QRK14159.1 IS21-like element helper ATPase IstB [Archangium violaceum]
MAHSLSGLGLHRTSAELDDLVARATKARLSPTQLLEQIVQLESDERARRSLERRTLRSRLGRFKPMADFDWSWPKSIDRPLVESLLRLDFLQDARNVVLLAAQGLGKTMIAQNLAHEALRSGHSVLFTTASQLLLDLGSRDSSRALESRLRHYARVGLLIIDELGYLSYDARNADLLFQLVNLRYEKRSLVLTTNQAFSDWPTIFPNASCATALIDRVIHHCDIVSIEGDSYRRREAEASLESRRSRRSG